MSSPDAKTTTEKLSAMGRVKKELLVFKDGLSMSGGDWGSLCQLFFDNLSTLLGSLLLIQSLSDKGDISASKEFTNQLIWGKIAPGVGLSMIFGNLFYTWQGCRSTSHYGRQYTAQPYGINTPAAFAVIFGVIYNVFFMEGGGDGALLKAYQLALATNFIVGLMTIILGLVGPFILKVVPPAGLLVPIAGIGFAFLGLDNVAKAVSQPLIGFNTLLWVYLGWYAGVRLGYKSFRLPEALQVILIGVIMGWATGVNTPDAVVDASASVKWYGATWCGGDVFAQFSLIPSYLGIIIPLGISATATSLLCLVSAKQAGDPYPVRTSMVFDGFGTCLAALFGSPFGTCLYIGHPAYKRNGAKNGYSLMNGLIYFVLSWFGVLALIQSIVNPATIGPIVFFVGLQVNEEALNFMPSRHYAAYIIGVFPSIFNWVMNTSGRSAMASDDGSYNINNLGDLWNGLLAFAQGDLLISLLWTSILVMVMDRRWLGASLWAFIASIFAVFGVIHQFAAGFKAWKTPTFEYCSADGCWDYSVQWMYFTAYLMLAGTFVLLHFVAKVDKTIEDPIIDETANAFDNWFSNAYTYVDEDGVERDSRDPDGKDLECAAEKAIEPALSERSSKRFGDEMAGTLTDVYGDQENEELDNRTKDDMIEPEATKALETIYPKKEEPGSIYQ